MQTKPIAIRAADDGASNRVALRDDLDLIRVELNFGKFGAIGKTNRLVLSGNVNAGLNGPARGVADVVFPERAKQSEVGLCSQPKVRLGSSDLHRNPIVGPEPQNPGWDRETVVRDNCRAVIDIRQTGA